MQTRLLVLSGLLGAAGIAVAVVPFRMSVPLGSEGAASARCRAPVVAVWHRGTKAPAELWTVSIRTNMEGPSPTASTAPIGVAPWCAEKARIRLAASGLLVGAAAGIAFRACRRLDGSNVA